MSSVAGYCFEPFKGEHQLERIISLLEEHLPEPYSVYTYRYFVNNWPQLTFTCSACGAIVGTIVGRIEVHKKSGLLRGYIGMLAVSEHHRRRGIGRALVEHLMRRMREERVVELVLEAFSSNAVALRMYESLGFFRDKFLPHYYFNGEDAFRLKCYFV